MSFSDASLWMRTYSEICGALSIVGLMWYVATNVCMIFVDVCVLKHVVIHGSTICFASFVMYIAKCANWFTLSKFFLGGRCGQVHGTVIRDVDGSSA